ncbi:MAG: TonB-dependent receptor [Sulfuricurvum sp.]|nr:TonB-dependent receptor [Sulfuricurvum sp.]
MKLLNGLKVTHLPILCVALLSIQSPLLAEESNDFDKVLEEITSIATKTKLNADYVPGTVTVISGEKLKSLGITNLAEQNAFDTIVGSDSSTLSLRGAGSIYGSQGNKIKWMINDKPISAEIWGLPKLGTGQIVFPIPIDAIERIEVIRGPGSAIYGGNAIYGVMNIITKKGREGVFTTLSRMESNKFGKAVGGYGTFEKNDLKVSTIVSVDKSDGWNLPVASQSIGQQGNLPNASGGNLLMADATYKNIDFWAYRLEAKNDYARLQWDPTNYLPQDNTKPVQSNTHTMLGVQGKYDILPDVFLTAKAGLNHYTNRAEVVFFPASVLQNNPNNLDGVRTIDYTESTKYAEATLETTQDSHRFLGGIYAGILSIDQDNVTQRWNSGSYADPAVSTHLITINNPKRINKALYLQDEIQMNEQTTATIGARYDTYSDGRSALSPRIAFVHQYDDSNILKAQYSRAFRAPSLSEQYSPNNQSPYMEYKSETADTVELSYIFKTNSSSFKTTAFNTKTYNMITYHDFTYETINLESPTTVNGVEVELTKNYKKVDLGANMSFYRSHRGEVKLTRSGFTLNYDPSEFALSANLLANFYATINSDTPYPTTFWYHYTGKKNRVNNALLDANGNIITIYTTNGSVPVQDYVNVTQKINDVAKNLDLEFGVKNIFGKTLKTLYFPLNPPDTYDVPYMGQTFWINMLYTF